MKPDGTSQKSSPSETPSTDLDILLAYCERLNARHQLLQNSSWLVASVSFILFAAGLSYLAESLTGVSFSAFLRQPRVLTGVASLITGAVILGYGVLVLRRMADDDRTALYNTLKTVDEILNAASQSENWSQTHLLLFKTRLARLRSNPY